MEIDYDDNDNTIESLRFYKEQMESRNFTKEQQNFLISQLVDKIVGMLLKSLKEQTDELDEFIAKYNLLLAIGRITTDDKKEEFRVIKRYKANSISYFMKKSNDLVKKLVEFRDEQSKK